MNLIPRHLLKLVGSLALAIVLILTAALGLALAQSPAGKLTRITFSASTDRSRDSSDPSISADGTKIVFHSDADFLNQDIPDEQYEIWLYDTATMTLTRVTTSNSPLNNRASWSPSISADGTKIAFASDADFLGQGIPNEQWEVWLYDTATLTLTRITSPTQSNDPDSLAPSLNTDGSKIAFYSDADFLDQSTLDGQFEIWLYDMTTVTFTRITTSTRGETLGNRFPHLNGDGTKIIFMTDVDPSPVLNPDPHWQIWLYDTDAMTLTRVSPGSDNSSPSISSDGTKIPFHSTNYYSVNPSMGHEVDEIWLYDTATMTATPVTPNPLRDYSRDSHAPGISGDGTKIAFQSDADFLNQGGIAQYQEEIWLYDLATMRFTRLTAYPQGRDRDLLNPTPNWDGLKIAFYSDVDFLDQGIADEQFEIWLYEAWPHLVLNKTASLTTPAPGQQITYTLTVANSGLLSATNALISDTLPAGLHFVGPITLEPSDVGVVGTALPLLASGLTISPGQRITVTFPVTLDLALGQSVAIANTAAVTSTEITTPVTSRQVITTPGPLLSLTKSVDDSTPKPGQQITYTLTVANSGLLSATNALISDTLPAGLTFVGPITLEPQSVGVVGTAPPTLASGLTISPGLRITVTFPVTVSTAVEVVGILITNQAAVTSAEITVPVTGQQLIFISTPYPVYLPLIMKEGSQ
jgi:uncharacterized repeat protein (TIGR01451 family)